MKQDFLGAANMVVTANKHVIDKLSTVSFYSYPQYQYLFVLKPIAFLDYL